MSPGASSTPKKTSPKKSPAKGTKRLKQSSIGDFVQPTKKAKLEPNNDENQDSHFVIQEIEEIEVYVCAKCDTNFSTIAEMKEHLPLCRTRTLNESLAEKVPADDCDVTHVVLEFPQKRVNTSITINTPVDFECDYSVDEKELELYENHNNKNNCFCCDEPVDSAHAGHIRCPCCVKSFKSNDQLRRHQVILHSQLPSAMECEQCNAIVATKKLMDMHMESHLTGKKFSCKSCGKDFTRKYHLERHLKFMNCDGTRTIIKYPCNVCNQSFARTDNLREHLKAHINPVEKTKDFQCPYCEKAFVGSSLLNIHIRTHTKEKP